MNPSHTRLAIPDELLDWIDRDSASGKIPARRLEAFQYLADHWEELSESHPGEYVAATPAGLEAHGPDWVRVYLELREQGVPWDDVAMRYCPDPKALAEILGCS